METSTGDGGEQADLAVLRRVVIGLQEDLQSDLLVPHLIRRRVADARTMLHVVASRHVLDAATAGTDWALAIDHVEELCEELERLAASQE